MTTDHDIGFGWYLKSEEKKDSEVVGLHLKSEEKKDSEVVGLHVVMR